jgi:hypothetical protein
MGRKRWVFRGKGANAMPKAKVHLGNVGYKKDDDIGVIYDDKPASVASI